MIAVQNNTATKLLEAVDELGKLASRQDLTRRDEVRMQALMATISGLKAGLSPQQIANAEGERLSKAAGLAHIAKPVRSEKEAEWRAMLKGEHRGVCKPINHEVIVPERRTQAAGTETIAYSNLDGSTFVPQNFHQDTIEVMRAFDDIFLDENCSVLESERGNPVTIPIMNDVSNASVQVGENTKSPESDFIAGRLPLGAFSFRSGIIYISIELIQDTGVPFGTLIEKAFAVRHARGVGAAMISGTGDGVTDTPQGLVFAATQTGNVTLATGANANTGLAGSTAANSIGTADLAAVWGQLDHSYRREAIWAMADSTYVSFLQMEDKIGHPIVRILDGLPTIFNRPAIVCPGMPAIAPSSYPIILYHPGFFWQRRVAAGSYIRKFMELPGGVEAGIIGFEGWLRGSSALAAPNTSYPPVSVLQMHS